MFVVKCFGMVELASRRIGMLDQWIIYFDDVVCDFYEHRDVCEKMLVQSYKVISLFTFSFQNEKE